MKDKVNLRKLENREYSLILDMINQDSILKETFLGERNTVSRLLYTDYAAFIKVEEQVVGFLMLVMNEKENVYEVDMGILQKYRNCGYGTEALKILKEIILIQNLDINIQVKKSNEPAKRSIQNNGFINYKIDEEHEYYKLENDEIKTK